VPFTKCKDRAAEYPGGKAEHEQRFEQRRPRAPRQRRADDRKAHRIVARIAEKIERVGLKRAAVRRRACDHFDQEHRALTISATQRTRRQRGSALAVSLPQALSQQLSAIQYPSRQIPSRTSIYTL
jgi:hypothetical protein